MLRLTWKLPCGVALAPAQPPAGGQWGAAPASPADCPAQVSLDKELIDFGSYLVGETATRTLTLTNVGGLGTSFSLLPACEYDELEETQSALKTVSPAEGTCGLVRQLVRMPVNESASQSTG